VNHFAGAFHLGRKDRLWVHLYDMMQRFQNDEFCVMPFTYILPRDSKKLRAYLSMQPIRHVILKPVRNKKFIMKNEFLIPASFSSWNRD
jgi:hypothetical protein